MVNGGGIYADLYGDFPKLLERMPILHSAGRRPQLCFGRAFKDPACFFVCEAIGAQITAHDTLRATS
jgi:hypothetical protein